LILVLLFQLVIIVVFILRNPYSIIKSSHERLIQLESRLQNYVDLYSRMESSFKEDMRHNREEISSSIHSFNESILQQFLTLSEIQKNQLDTFASKLMNFVQITEQKLEEMRKTIEERLRLLQEENSRKLDQMREIVDKELHSTLEKRLGESFRLVSERLEQVYRGLGEMQALAASVGDLKKVLSNVKTRGIFGEMQLGAILEHILSPDQYDRNVAVKKGSGERVEYAIKVPNKNGDGFIYLPIDAKFPVDSYQRLVEAYELGDPNLIDSCARDLERVVKDNAKTIRDKYIDPPNTTDFAIMFLPSEGLYAEVLRRPGLLESIQREYRVTVTGPTTLAAFLNSLQMGFRTLAIEKRSSEIWTLLGAIKTEFSRFGDILEKTHKKIIDASKAIEEATKRTRTIERRLKDVEELPRDKALETLGFAEEDDTIT